MSKFPHLVIPHFLICSFDEFTCLVHRCLTSEDPIPSHGFAGPLKCTTAAASTTCLSAREYRYPKPDTCHEGSRMWRWLSNASKAGGRAPGCQSSKPELRLCITKKYIYMITDSKRESNKIKMY